MVDVREPGEYVAGHVRGSALVPMGQLASRLGELDKDRPVYVLCASRNRSAAMTDLLRAAGVRPLLRRRRHGRLRAIRASDRDRHVPSQLIRIVRTINVTKTTGEPVR